MLQQSFYKLVRLECSIRQIGVFGKFQFSESLAAWEQNYLSDQHFLTKRISLSEQIERVGKITCKP